MSRRTAKLLTAAVLGSVIFSTSSLRAEDKAKAPEKANIAPARSLNRPLPDLKFTGTNFSDVVDFIADSTGANFSVDWKALEAVHVNKDTPITLRLSSAVPLRKALKLILQQAGGAGVLTFYVDDGVIQITSQEQSDKELITRIYPIQDLLFQAPDYNDAPSLDLTQNNSGGSGGGKGGGGGGGQQSNLFSNSNGGGNSNQNKANQSRKERADEIIKLITDSVRPELWQANGGTSTISFFRDSLIVTAPRSIHEALSSH